MAEKLNVSRGVMAEELDGLGRDHDEKLQTLARSVVSGLYMLIRSVRMYEPTNRIFDRPLVALQDSLNAIIAREGRLELVGIRDALYLNGMLVKVDAASLENVRQLLEDLRSRDVTGFTLVRPAQLDELQNFIWIFARDQQEQADEDGIAGRKLMAMKLARWSKLKDKIEREQQKDHQRIDRKKYALVVYARAVFFVRRYMASMATAPLGSTQALRIVQDLVDLSLEQPTHFLGMTTLRSDDRDYLAYHQVNVCLMAIVMGRELGLTKQQLRDLGFIALLHDAGMHEVPLPLRQKTGPFSREEKATVYAAPLVSVRSILREKTISRSTLIRIVATFEHKADFGRPMRDELGRVQVVPARTELSVYARIIAICTTYDALTTNRPFRGAYGPDVAMALMGTELRHKYDPALLPVFMKVMRLAPVQQLQAAKTITLGE